MSVSVIKLLLLSLLVTTEKKMLIKKMDCSLCNICYKSRFCLSLHQHVHHQLSKILAHVHHQLSKLLAGFQCSSCKKIFVKLDGFERHLQYHWYSNLVKSSVKAKINNDGKSRM